MVKALKPAKASETVVVALKEAETVEPAPIEERSPLGAKLARGAVLIIDDGAPVSVPFDTCWQSGCLARRI